MKRLDTARALWPADRPPPLISSFELPSLEVALAHAPDWPRGYLIDKRPADWAAIADRLQATTLNVNARREDARSIAAYLATGRPVLAYTVNDPAASPPPDRSGRLGGFHRLPARRAGGAG